VRRRGAALLRPYEEVLEAEDDTGGDARLALGTGVETRQQVIELDGAEGDEWGEFYVDAHTRGYRGRYT